LTCLDPDPNNCILFLSYYSFEAVKKIMFPTWGVGGSHSWGMFSYFSKSKQKTTMISKEHKLMQSYQQPIQHLQLKLGQDEKSYVWFRRIRMCFGPPGSGSGSISTRYGSGSFYHQAKVVRKTFLSVLSDILSLTNDVNVAFKSNKRKNLRNK
jgi:hypothetical protein